MALVVGRVGGGGTWGSSDGAMQSFLTAMGAWLAEQARALEVFATTHTYLALLLILGVEEAGVPLPVPGDTIIVYAGYRVAAGAVSPWLAGLVVMVATVLGSSVLYWLARMAGRALVYRHGSLVGLDARRLDRMADWLGRHEAQAIILGRLIPGLRTASSVIAGVFEIAYPRFVVYTALSSVLWAAVYLGAGVILSREAARLTALTATLAAWPVAQLVLAAALAGWFAWRSLELRARRAAGPVREAADD